MTRWSRENDFDDLFRAAASREAAGARVAPGFLFALAKAIAAQESQFEPTAYHWDGPDSALNVSRGIMQVEGKTAQRYGLTYFGDDGSSGPDAPAVDDSRRGGLYEVPTCIGIGVAVLAANLRASGGDVDQAIAAYNEGTVQAGRDAPGPYRNQPYVDAVKANLAYFLPPDAPAPASAVNAGKGDGLALGGVVVVLIALGLFWLLAGVVAR